MREHFEELWERMPPDVHPPDLAARRAFLLAHLRPGDRLLDLGCGDGTFAGIAAEAGAQALGVDVAEAALARARRRHPALELRLAPAGGPLPVEDGAFDVVWASEVLEHVPDTARWLSEARRALRPGGRLLLTTPHHGRLRRTVLALTRFEAHFDPRSDHLRFFTRRSLAEVLEELGFADVRLATAGGPPLWRRTLLASARRPEGEAGRLARAAVAAAGAP